MLKKKLLTGFTVLSVLAVPFAAFATTSDSSLAKGVRSFLHFDMTKLSDTQKADVTTYAKKSADIQKEFINKMLADGAITKDQATKQISFIDERLKSGNPEGLLEGFCGGRSEGGHRKGRMNGQLFSGIDLSKLSQIQKADMLVTINSIVTQQKKFNATLVANGMISQQEANEKNTAMDKLLNDIVSNKIPQNIEMLFMHGAGMQGMGNRKALDLNDKQKADILDNATKMKALYKELIGKLQASNTITLEQATSINKVIDTKDFDKTKSEGRIRGHGMKGERRDNMG